MQIETMATTSLIPYARNARTHSKPQIQQIASSIRKFGFNNPILISETGEVIAGHGRLEAAKLLGMTEVPVIRLAHLSEVERKAYIIADNQLALKAGWDKEILAIELQGLIALDFEVEITGFDTAEIDIIIGEAEAAKPTTTTGPEDETPAVAMTAVTEAGDVWALGRHRLICGDARRAYIYAALMAGELADMVITDPPYNVKIDGHVGGSGQVRHREFAMAAGEMSRETFTIFLTDSLGEMAKVCRDGAIANAFMDWRHLPEIITAGEAVFSHWMNTIAWVKSNGGLGTFYRSRHEMVLVFKKGDAPHTNTFGLGATGRYRTNVWEYAGVNTFKAERMTELGMHPTVKPVAMIEDAIKDVTRRGEVVLDGFGGSGTTLIAAERCGRRARLVELDPLYCDLIVRRWQAYTGKRATREADGLSFETVENSAGRADGEAA